MRVADEEQLEATSEKRSGETIRGWLPLVLALAALLFNAGWSYAVLGNVSTKVDALPSALELNYVRKDVFEERTRAFAQQLDEVKKLLEKLQPAARTSSSDTSPGPDYSRRFDR